MIKRLRNERKRAERRAYPLTGFVGPNGGGKTLAMVWDTLPTLDAGRRVLSTVRILDYRDPRPCEGFEWLDGVKVDCTICYGAVSDPDGMPYAHGQVHPLYERLTDWGQLIEARKCDALLDEVTGVASSRDSAGLPSPVANKLVQLRRADVVMRWSAPAWARSDKIIRETSQSVVYCTGHLSTESGDADRMWRQRRLFKWRSFDATEFEDFTAGKREQMGRLLVDWHWGPGSPAFSAYDTYDAVSVVGTVTDHGACYQCGGSRPRPKCSCVPVHVAPSVAHDAGSPESATPEAGASDGPTPGRMGTRRLDVVSLARG